MNIGIDVDGVLVDMEKYQLKYGKKFFLSRHNINIKNPKAYDVQEIFLFDYRWNNFLSFSWNCTCLCRLWGMGSCGSTVV